MRVDRITGFDSRNRGTRDSSVCPLIPRKKSAGGDPRNSPRPSRLPFSPGREQGEIEVEPDRAVFQPAHQCRVALELALVALLFIVDKRRRINADQQRADNVSVLPTTLRAALTWSAG